MEEKLKEELRVESIERLKILEKKFGLLPTVRKEFEKDGTLYYAERSMLGGILYWVHNEDKYVEIVKKFEKEHNTKVYFCLLTYTEFGTLFDMFYVSSDKSVWEEDKEDLESGLSLVYCENLDEEMFSEFGSIAFKGMSGGIVRVA